MCGIAGVINASSKIITEYNGFIKDALLAGTVRGVDSVGLAAITTGGKRVAYKDVLNPISFINTVKAKEIIDDADSAFFTLLHHRAATIGRVSPEAAQPFTNWNSPNQEFEPILCHNGTLTNHTLYDTALKRSFASDSEWLAHKFAGAIKDDGSVDPNQVFGDLAGSFSVVAALSDRVYMVNNGSRPMNIAWSEDSSGVLFASEAGMLYWLADRNKIKLRDNKIITLAADVVYEFDFGELKNRVVMKSTPLVKRTQSYSSYQSTGTTVTNYTLKKLDDLHAKMPGPSGTTVTQTETPPVVEPTVGEGRAYLAKPGANIVQFAPSINPDREKTKTELEGKFVDFTLSTYDANIGIIYGTGWLPDANGEAKFSANTEKVLNAGNVMVTKSTTDNIVDFDDKTKVYSGRIEKIRYVSEQVKQGNSHAYMTVPYMEIDGASIVIVEQGDTTVKIKTEEESVAAAT